MPLLYSAASSSSACFWNSVSIERESLSEKGIHFLGLAAGLSEGDGPVEENGFRFGIYFGSC
jgi:hypothetical protein